MAFRASYWLGIICMKGGHIGADKSISSFFQAFTISSLPGVPLSLAVVWARGFSR